jgi:hypothetical protein
MSRTLACAGCSGVSSSACRLQISDSIVHGRLGDAGFPLDFPHRLALGLHVGDLLIDLSLGLPAQACSSRSLRAVIRLSLAEEFALAHVRLRQAAS